MECCGRTYLSNNALQKHVKNKHTTLQPVYRCFAENCGKNFRLKQSFQQHQISHHYVSNQYEVLTQAFQGATLVLRKKLEGQGLYGLEFITTPECVSEVSLILNSEICKKKSIIFKLAVVLNFYKIDLNGVETEVQPVFCSNNVYLNSASTFVSHRILEDSLTTMKSRFDDFIGKGSGKPSNYIDHTKFSIIIDVNGM